MIFYIITFFIIYGLSYTIYNSTEKFALSAGTVSSKTTIDPNKFYYIGSLKTSNTVTPSQNGGIDCSEFPSEIYKLAAPINAVCKTTDIVAGNDDTNYNYTPAGIWGMAITRTFVSTFTWPWTTKGILIYLRNKTTGKYLVWSNSTTCADNNLAACDIDTNAASSGSRPFFYGIPTPDIDVKTTGMWLCIKDSQGRNLIKPWAGSVANSTLCLKPMACADNNQQLTIGSVEDKDCSAAAGGTNYYNGNPYAYSSWYTTINGKSTAVTQSTTPGIWIGHQQSDFPIHPSGGTANDKVFPILYKYMEFTGNDGALFEWRYTKYQP